jgi:hypothetical protein
MSETGYPMPLGDFLHCRFLLFAGCHCHWAARVEATAAWWIGRAGQIALQEDAVALPLFAWIGNMHC